MKHKTILNNVKYYYENKIGAYGPTPQGVDWNSPESQSLRFMQLLKVCDTESEFLINDYGCGYGALIEFMIVRGYMFKYRGFDISKEMIIKAQELHKGMADCLFFVDDNYLTKADYTVASGIFNVKLHFSDEEWQVYMRDTINRIAELSIKGFAINVLTSYSDKGFMRPDLYYANPLFWFDYCKRHFSKFVALLHDYPLYEFTILVKK